MKSLSFLIGLRLSYEAYQSEILIAEEGSSYEYLRFLKTMKFYDFIDQVATACVMYPRSLDLSRDELNSLAYVMYRSMGLGSCSFYLTTMDQSKLTDLILLAGNEIINTLDANHYYLSEHELPRMRNGQRVMEADLIAVPNVTKVGVYTFKIEIKENSQDDDDVFSPQIAGLSSLNIRSY